MPHELLKFLTPDQLDKLRDGWHTAIVFGVGDFDTLHMALTLDYHDESTEALWNDIKKQLRQGHYLSCVGKLINDLPTPP